MIQCTASREWSATPPHCEAIHCAILQAPQDGNITCTDTTGKLHYGSTCSFTCHAGFTLHGSEVMKCDASGDWVGQKPLCRGEPVLGPPFVAVVTAGGAGLTALSAIAWFLKQLRQRKKVKQFDLNSGMNTRLTHRLLSHHATDPAEQPVRTGRTEQPDHSQFSVPSDHARLAVKHKLDYFIEGGVS
ncbi:hypothetical protein SKAU_G00199800 [Synaphobranchus kaupii]|uniref:Sushi domain-containing protein n=1 Tax=Synaphobranchus kaupii TaxID=118154 RepID=A0A9Q1FFC1_SYNKA|nr:hypothetical protein SKAU_G00199800 [Synaphobranchus kaupii]